MNIAIVGYGKMGKEIEQVVANDHVTEQKLGHSVVIDPTASRIAPRVFRSFRDFSENDPVGGRRTTIIRNNASEYVFIDFTEPDQAMKNIEWYAANKVNAVIGTTGWTQHLPAVEKLVKDSGIGLVYSSNFSTSVQMAFFINKIMAALLAEENYDVTVKTEHHIKKKDHSGTGKTLAADIINTPNSGKNEIIHQLEQGKEIKPEQLCVTDTYVGNVFGNHEVKWWNMANNDVIKLEHNAGGRTAFAQGAVDAARFIDGRTGLYNYAEALKQDFMGRLLSTGVIR